VKLAAAIGFLLLNLYIYHEFATESVQPSRSSFDHLPLAAGAWVCEHPERMEDAVAQNLGVTDYHLCNWTFTGTASPDMMPFQNVYIGYHASQVREQGGGAGEHTIHPPAHCLPGAGWDIIRLETASVDLPGLPESPARVRRLQIAKGNDRELVYYWYQSNGRVIAEDWKKILYLGWDRARLGRTDGALVRFTIPIVNGNEAAADAAFADLAPKLVEHLGSYVPD
jgi:EpsI family protein